jgi:hypothetical protein
VFVTKENIDLNMKQSSLITKTEKLPFYEEKSLVGLAFVTGNFVKVLIL